MSNLTMLLATAVANQCKLHQLPVSKAQRIMELVAVETMPQVFTSPEYGKSYATLTMAYKLQPSPNPVVSLLSHEECSNDNGYLYYIECVEAVINEDTHYMECVAFAQAKFIADMIYSTQTDRVVGLLQVFNTPNWIKWTPSRPLPFTVKQRHMDELSGLLSENEYDGIYLTRFMSSDATFQSINYFSSIREVALLLESKYVPYSDAMYTSTLSLAKAVL